MKRLICFLIALAMMLCACGGPVETTAPAETTLPAVTEPVIEAIMPAETTVPLETTVPVETTIPVETVPHETAVPVETSVPDYTLRVEDPETMIYAGPSFVSGAVGMVGEVGTYTIVEEATDADGNRWGRLKSGAGWLCLTVPPFAPIYADYAPESFNAFYAFWSDETDYITSIGFTPGETLTDVKFGLLDWFETESWQMSQVLHTIDEMDPDHPFLAQVVFWGDMTTYGISFTDESGEMRHFAVSISGKDGSLICQEYK